MLQPQQGYEDRQEREVDEDLPPLPVGSSIS
jgi:hypothetical protein